MSGTLLDTLPRLDTVHLHCCHLSLLLWHGRCCAVLSVPASWADLASSEGQKEGKAHCCAAKVPHMRNVPPAIQGACTRECKTDRALAYCGLAVTHCCMFSCKHHNVPRT